MTELRKYKELDEKYLQDLKEKYRIIEEREQQRQQAWESQSRQFVQQIQRRLSDIQQMKPKMDQKNVQIKKQIQSHVYKFHKDLQSCYAADDELRTKKNYYQAYLRLNQPSVAADLAFTLQNHEKNLEQKLFGEANYEPHVQLARDQLNDEYAVNQLQPENNEDYNKLQEKLHGSQADSNKKRQSFQAYSCFISKRGSNPAFSQEGDGDDLNQFPMVHSKIQKGVVQQKAPSPSSRQNQGSKTRDIFNSDIVEDFDL